MAFPIGRRGDGGDDVGDDAFGLVGVAMEVGDDHFHGDVGFIDLPAIVVGRHGERGVGDLGFARALGFAEVGHADDVVAGLVIANGFGAGAEGGAFHVHIRAAVVDAGLEGAGGLEQKLAQFLANRIGEGDVRDNAAAEKRVRGGLLGAVDELVDQHDVARPVFLLERANGADADDPVDAELFHRPDVGAVVQLGREEAMTAAVAREKDDIAPRETAGEEVVGGRAEGRPDLHPFLLGEALDVIEAAAADDADALVCHKSSCAAGRARARGGPTYEAMNRGGGKG